MWEYGHGNENVKDNEDEYVYYSEFDPGRSWDARFLMINQVESVCAEGASSESGSTTNPSAGYGKMTEP